MSQQQFTQFSFSRQETKIPNGVHLCQVVGVEEREGREFPYISLQLQLQSDEDWGGRMVWAIASLSPQARWKLNELLDALDLPEDGEGTAESFLGHSLKCEIVWEEYTTSDGQKAERAQVKRFLKATTSTTPTSQGSFSVSDLKTKKPSTKKKGPELPEDVTES